MRCPRRGCRSRSRPPRTMSSVMPLCGSSLFTSALGRAMDTSCRINFAHAAPPALPLHPNAAVAEFGTTVVEVGYIRLRLGRGPGGGGLGDSHQLRDPLTLTLPPPGRGDCSALAGSL